MFKSISYQKYKVLLFMSIVVCPVVLFGSCDLDLKMRARAILGGKKSVDSKNVGYNVDDDGIFRIQPLEISSDDEDTQEELSEESELQLVMAEPADDISALIQEFDLSQQAYVERIEQFLADIQFQLLAQSIPYVYIISTPGLQLLDVVTYGNNYAKLGDNNIPVNSSLFGQRGYQYPYSNYVPAIVQAYNIPISSLMIQGAFAKVLSTEGGLIKFIDDIIAAAGFSQSTFKHMCNSVLPVKGSARCEIDMTYKNWQAFSEWTEQFANVQIPSFSYLFSYYASGYAPYNYTYPINAQLWFYLKGSYHKVPATIKELIGQMIDAHEVKAICKEGQRLLELETHIKQIRQRCALEAHAFVNNKRDIGIIRVNEVVNHAEQVGASIILQAASRGMLARVQADLVQDAGERNDDAAMTLQAAVRGQLERI